MLTKDNLNLIKPDQVGLYIDGNWVTPVESGYFEINNPSTKR